MKRAQWKTHERQFAALLGGERVPVSGRQRGDQPDIAHPRFSCEVKAGSVLSHIVLEGMEQAVAAMKPGQIPIVCVANRKRGQQIVTDRYIVMRAEDFVEVVK